MKKLAQQFLRRNIYFLSAAALLFAIAFIVNNLRANYNSIAYLKNSIEQYIQDKEKNFEAFTTDTVMLQKLVTQQYSSDELERIINKPYGIYLYEPDAYGTITLKFWNNQDALPTRNIMNGNRRVGFIKLSSGQFEYIHRQVKTGRGKSIQVIGLLPIHREYYIQLYSHQKKFVNHPEAEKKVAISLTPGNYPVKSSYGDVLFYLQAKPQFSTTESNPVSLTLSLIAIIFLVIFIHNLAVTIARSFHYISGIFFLAGIIILVRGITYIFPGLLNLHQYALFDPKIYSSGYILRSLGDLLINAFLVCWLVLFIKNVIGDRSFVHLKNTRWRWPVCFMSLVILAALTFSGSNTIKSLIADARISFNVTNFFSLDIYSFTGFLVLANISFAYFFLSKILLHFLEPLIGDNSFLLMVLTAVAGLMLITMLQYAYNVELYLYTLVWLLLYVWLQRQRMFAGYFFNLNISLVLFWLFIYSLSISVIIIYENKKIELQQMKRTAEKLSSQSDPSVEILINLALMYIDNNFLYSNFERFKVATSNTYLKDSLTNKNFSPYLDKFDTRIYTYDESKNSLYNEESVSFDTLNTIYEIEGKRTSVNLSGLRFFEKAYDKYAYICKKVVQDSARKTVGYLFILSDPKQFKSDALDPELYRKEKNYLPEYSPIYSYAIYNNLQLSDYYNNYQFPRRLTLSQLPQQEFYEKKNDGYDELWYNEGNNKVVIFAKKNNYLIEGITLFAYIFSTFLLLVAIFRMISLLVLSRMKWTMIRHYWQFNIRSQIHGTIIFISLFSFLVIGIATILFFNNRYQRTKEDRLSKTIQIMANEVQNKMVDHTVFNDMFRFFETDSDNKVQTLINEVAAIHGTDINLYDTLGNLLVASNPFIYSYGVLSNKMNPMAYYYMRNAESAQYANQEHMGDVTYQSIYSPVLDEKGNVYAYLNIPSFDSQEELKREISNFLVTIINLNAFIFLVAGVIALFITNRITSSFLLIGHKMQEINLGKLNEEIAWDRDDEIGGLVKEYNKMVVKLGESAFALAKSEREGAWREMARQVAHEIKNPLTPMKLSIQYLLKAIDNDSVNVKEFSSNVARTLIEQIDHLSKIASDFSQFANIGNVKNELFDLHELLYSLSSLYESTENLEFNWYAIHQPIQVMADKTQLNRLFTNLFQNAVEAGSDRDTRVLTVTEEAAEGSVIIKVADNGAGIPQGMQSKIFTPNFTTKSSGTGLGLAMCKTIVEQAKGSIWFETVEGKGTTFFVELPLVKPAEAVAAG